MDLKQIEYFITAYKFQSINKAAKALFVSQPTISKSISCLEVELGGKLFERDTKGIRLTPFGRVILHYCYDIQMNVNTMRNALPKSSQSVFYVDTYISPIFCDLICRFHQYFGDSTIIHHRNDYLNAMVTHVERNEVEIAVLYVSKHYQKLFQDILAEKKLVFQPIAFKKLCVLVGPKNTYYNNNSISSKDFKNLKFVRKEQYYSLVEQKITKLIYPDLKEDLNYAVYTNNTATMMQLLRFTDVAKIGIDDYCDCYNNPYPSIHALPITDIDSEIVIGCVHHCSHELSLNARWFLDTYQGLINGSITNIRY